MNCCGAGSHKLKQNNNLPLSEEPEPKDSALKKIAVWGIVFIVIAGLISLLL